MGIPCPVAPSQIPESKKVETRTTIDLQASSSFSPLGYKMNAPFPQTKSSVPKTNFSPNLGMTTLVLFAVMFSFAIFTLPNTFSTIPGFDSYAASPDYVSRTSRRLQETHHNDNDNEPTTLGDQSIPRVQEDTGQIPSSRGAVNTTPDTPPKKEPEMKVEN